MSSRRRAVPFLVPLFTVALAGVAIATASAAGSPGLAAPPWVVVPLAATLIVAGLIQVKFQWRDQQEALDLFEAALVPLIAVFAGPGAVLLTAVTKLVSQRLLGVAPVKLFFNTAQWSAAAGIASLVYESIRREQSLHPLGLAAALASAMVVNHLAVATVLAIVNDGSVRDVVAALRTIFLPGWFVGGAINVSFGLLFAVVVVEQPGMSALFLVPLAVVGLAQRAYSEVLIDRRRLAALQQATHHLAGVGPAGLDERAVDRALPAVLESIRAAFSSAVVAVVPFDESLAVHLACESADGTDPDPAAHEPLLRALADRTSTAGACRVARDDTSAAGQALAESTRRVALTAPLRRQGILAGMLISLDRSGLGGFGEGELAVFEALAGEISSALDRAGLHERVERERAHLFDIVDRSSDGIFTITSTGLVDDWNPAMAAMTGLDETDASGGRVSIVLRTHAAEGNEPVRLEDWVELGPEKLPPEVCIVARDGAVRRLACSYSQSGANPPSLIVVARDVTHQRELDRLRDDFVATVSHELRTPLTSIVGFTSMLLETARPLTEEQRSEAAAMIRKGARRLERLVFNLLEVSRVEAGSIVQPARPLDIERACEAALAEVRETWPRRDVRIEHASGAVQSFGNQMSVEQILANLIGNALKYSEGDVEVRVTESPESLSVSVSDFGPGIARSEHEKIFERFHRLDHSHVQAGTGLGLYISRQLAMAMSGTLTVESEPGHGSTFTLTLPAELDLVAVG